MRIGLFTDVHANLPALTRSIDRFEELKCDRIIHLGDLIGIGPYPKECLEYCLAIKRMEFIMGNHDYWYGFGLPNPIPKWMNNDEVEHQLWTHSQIGKLYKSIVRNWKFELYLDFDKDIKIVCQHYALNETKNWYKTIERNPTGKKLDELFNLSNTEMIFYGHQHKASDIFGRTRYINLGSNGCHNEATARIGILDYKNGELKLTKESLKYDDRNLLNEFELRQVPARKFIRNVFLPRK